LTLRYKLYCDTNYYSSDCSVYCIARNDNTNGHYTCDPATGNIICRPGIRQIDLRNGVNAQDAVLRYWLQQKLTSTFSKIQAQKTHNVCVCVYFFLSVDLGFCYLHINPRLKQSKPYSHQILKIWRSYCCAFVNDIVLCDGIRKCSLLCFGTVSDSQWLFLNVKHFRKDKLDFQVQLVLPHRGSNLVSYCPQSFTISLIV